MENTKNLIENVLKSDAKEIAFEPVPEENESPLSQPVVERTTASNDGHTSTGNTAETQEPKAEPKPTDAPEQKIDAEPAEEPKTESESEGEEFTMPLEHAGLMADSIIGTVNSTVLEIGGGYFVTIRKHKEFYDFEEVIQIIDEQNVKNVNRLKLDEEDKAMLRPLLMHILRKKAAALTPEKQLVMVICAILIKKAKAVMEMRSENEILVDRIRDVIRKEMQEHHAEENVKAHSSATEHAMHEESDAEYEESYSKPRNNTGLPDEALEVM